MNTFELIRIQPAETSNPMFFIWNEKEEHWCRLSEAELAKAIPGYRELSEKARMKRFRKYLDSKEIVDCGILPEDLPNTRHFRGPDGKKRVLTQEELRAGAEALLALGTLFPDPAPGWELLADLLTGLWCAELRKAEPEFRSVTTIPLDTAELRRLFKLLVKTSVPRKRWRRGKFRIWRRAVLDYGERPDTLPLHIQDFTQIKRKVPGRKPLRMPAAYSNTLVLMIGANSEQLREAEPFLENAGVLMMGCAGNTWGGRRISRGDLSALDPAVAEQLQEKRTLAAAVLTSWWAEGRASTARSIVQAAKRALGKPDSRFISVIYDPKILGKAIRYQVLLAFLSILEEYGILESEALASYQAAVKQAYDPDPEPEVPIRHAEDPEVFLEIMRALAAKGPIVGPEERFCRGDKALGAWRDISGVRHLVLLEGTWKKTYARAAHAMEGLDLSFLKQDGWERALQKKLAEAGYLKCPSAGYRYRFDLLGTGERDKTYVVAIPQHLLEA